MNRARVWRKGLFNDHVIVNLFLIVQSAVSIFRQKTEVSLIDRKKTKNKEVKHKYGYLLILVRNRLGVVYRSIQGDE